MKNTKSRRFPKIPTITEVILSLFMLSGVGLIVYSYIKGARIDFLKLGLV